MQIEDLFTLVLFVFACKFDQICSLTNENTCTPTSAGNSSIDDVPAINSALLTCGNGGTIIISSNTIFMIRSPLDFANCRQCSFQIEGTLKVSDDLNYWNGKTAFILLQNITGATIQSLTGMGIIDGSGQVYWDYFAKHKTYKRPLLMFFSNASNITFNNIKLKDAPMMFVTVKDKSYNISFSDLILSAVSTSVNDPKNTDGFDIGECSHVTLNNIHVTNGDDCVAFENGANYITVNNITCVGSHGVSVGSLGLGAGETYVVQNVYVSKIKMINCSKAAGIKLWPGGSSHGSVFVTNVTYDGVIVDNCDYAFQIMNCYESESKTCEKHPSTARLSRIHLMNFTGKTSRKYEPHVANIDCPPNGTCDLTFTGWDIIAPHRKSVVLCAHYDHPSGVKCTPGAFG
ncbi:unnamed protein product [Adineta ricciae]|uniref:Uncharacterized protein n=1 Tax=Adineta ricciae TaxID=249248 RepID=A0A814FRT5_ADIRI|nr:unnamed protein product [Adineta ricciae]